jgi:hypothetical protein
MVFTDKKSQNIAQRFLARALELLALIAATPYAELCPRKRKLLRVRRLADSPSKNSCDNSEYAQPGQRNDHQLDYRVQNASMPATRAEETRAGGIM